jgi:hypothetical protein
MAVPSGIGPVLYPASAGGGGAAAVRGDWKPQHQNFKGATYDTAILHAGSFASPGASGYLHMTKMWVEDPAALANLHFYVYQAAAGLTAGQCRGAIFSSGGVLLARTADLASLLGTVGFKTFPLTPEAGQSLAVGGPSTAVFGALLLNGTTWPSILGVSPSNGFPFDWNVPNDSSGWRFLRPNAGGYTSIPAALPAPGAMVEDQGRAWWMGVS